MFLFFQTSLTCLTGLTICLKMGCQ
jgi:hypothetical protein